MPSNEETFDDIDWEYICEQAIEQFPDHYDSKSYIINEYYFLHKKYGKDKAFEKVLKNKEKKLSKEAMKEVDFIIKQFSKK